MAHGDSIKTYHQVIQGSLTNGDRKVRWDGERTPREEGLQRVGTQCQHKGTVPEDADEGEEENGAIGH